MKSTIKNKDNNTVTIKFNNTDYTLEKDKLKYIFDIAKLSVDINNNSEIYKALKEYKLLDEVFLKNVNKLW